MSAFESEKLAIQLPELRGTFGAEFDGLLLSPAINLPASCMRQHGLLDVDAISNGWSYSRSFQIIPLSLGKWKERAKVEGSSVEE